MAYEPPKQTVFGAGCGRHHSAPRHDRRRALHPALSRASRVRPKLPSRSRIRPGKRSVRTRSSSSSGLALGVTDPAAANDIITARFDYTFSWTALIVMAVLVIGYFVLVVRLSDKEYREVIENVSARQR